MTGKAKKRPTPRFGHPVRHRKQEPLRVLSHAQLLARDASRATPEQVEQARQQVRAALEELVRDGQLNGVRHVWVYDRLYMAGRDILVIRFPHLGFFLRRAIAMETVATVCARCLSWLPSPEQEWRNLRREEESWAQVREGTITVEGMIDHFLHRVSAVPFNHEAWAIIDRLTTEGITPALRAEARDWWWFFTLFCPGLANAALEWRTLLDLTVPDTPFAIDEGIAPQVLPIYWEARGTYARLLWFRAGPISPSSVTARYWQEARPENPAAW